MSNLEYNDEEYDIDDVDLGTPGEPIITFPKQGFDTAKAAVLKELLAEMPKQIPHKNWGGTGSKDYAMGWNSALSEVTALINSKLGESNE